MDIKDMNNIDIYNKYAYYINQVYEEYAFLNIDREEYKRIVLKLINKSKKRYDAKCPYKVYLKDIINDHLLKYLNKELTDDDKEVDIISNYINLNFIKTSLYSYSVLYLKKLSELFSNINYYPNPDVIIKLIDENSKLNKVLSVIVNNHINDIDNGKINEMFSEFIIFMINTYCEINKIDKKLNFNNNDLADYSRLDSLDSYFIEMEQMPFLTRQEEIKYGYEILKGNMDARNKLVEGNLKLVVSIAKRFLSSGMPYNDLIQDGNEGLIVAANKFDVRKGYHFSTYAAWWITCKIQRAIFVNIYKQKRLNTVSLSEFVYNDEDLEIGDMLYDEDTLDDKIYILDNLPDDIKRLFMRCKLNEREMLVLTKVFGLDGEKPLTQDGISKQLNITRERVRQIEATGLRKLRQSHHTDEYAIYLDDPDESKYKLDLMRELYSQTKSNSFKIKYEDFEGLDELIKKKKKQ